MTSSSTQPSVLLSHVKAVPFVRITLPPARGLLVTRMMRPALEPLLTTVMLPPMISTADAVTFESVKVRSEQPKKTVPPEKADREVPWNEKTLFETWEADTRFTPNVADFKLVDDTDPPYMLKFECVRALVEKKMPKVGPTLPEEWLTIRALKRRRLLRSRGLFDMERPNDQL